jgi:Heterokaryon incompatibility protein (HET)
MRLLNTKTLELCEFSGEKLPQYAILSHTWGDNEISFQKIQEPDCKHSLIEHSWCGQRELFRQTQDPDLDPDYKEKLKGVAKIAGCCAQASNDELDWVWIDTCCIDKSSSAELTEAINSMYAWYAKSAVCYVYLLDVPPLSPELDERKFAAARWFTRGWCLQELIAPTVLEFYSGDWTELGTKMSLKRNLEKITSIPVSVLMGDELPSTRLVAERMSWASKRTTTRVEDTAYCLLGIFDINMPLLYGEGSKAMIRLQEEILKRDEDYSLFLWRTPGDFQNTGFLCDSPSYFQLGGLNAHGRQLPYSKLERHRNKDSTAPEITSRGLRMDLLIRSFPGRKEFRLAWTLFKHEEEYVCIVLGECESKRFDYDRIFASSVYLLTEEDLILTPFTSECVYLPPFYTMSMQIIPDEWLSFKLHLHSPAGISLDVVGVYPEFDLQKSEDGLLYTRVFSLLECPGKLSLLIRVRHLEMEAHAVAIFNMFDGKWGGECLIRKHSEGMGSLQQISSNIWVLQHQDGLSDRSMTSVLPSSYITAATKSRPGLYLAHITFLPLEYFWPDLALEKIQRPSINRSNLAQ